MGCCGNQIGVPNSSVATGCVDRLGCQNGCSDFTIRRYDTKPTFRIAVEDCNGPIDLSDTNLVVEVNMWALGKLKSNLPATDSTISLADNIGFEQAMIGDVIVVDRVRSPEHMLITEFDETNKTIKVQRGYHETTASIWKKGTVVRIFRMFKVIGAIEEVREDIIQEDGTTKVDQLTASELIVNWEKADTALPGCYWLEFKLIKMASDEGIEWNRRFPVSGEGFFIKIVNTPTAEL